jgi:pimeloyl-ACP methyl ester carboxylesterase
MKLSGIERAYDDVGSGPAIVLLHGFPFDRSMWREQLEFLSANGFRAIAPDLRGLGENRVLSQVSTMEDMARDVAALMDDLEIDRAAVCGLSMGSYVAFEFLRHFPSRFRALVLAGARAQPADEAEKESREQQAQRVLDQGLGFAVDSIFTNLLAKPALSEKAGVISRVREMILRTDPRGAAAAQRGMAARRDYSRDLAGITVPTLIIAGREDAVRRPDDAEFIHHGVRNSRLEIIDEAGHLMNMEQPEIFNQALIGFLEAFADTAGAPS